MMVLARICFASGFRETFGEHERRREAARFRRVNRRRDENDVLTLLEQAVSLSRGLEARIHQLPLDLAIVLEVCQRRRIGDDGDDEWPAEHRFADRAHGDARTRLVQRREVIRDLLPARQMAIGARLKPEDRGRCGDRIALRDGGTRDGGDGRREKQGA
jgi:hypothetical protein